MARTDGIPLFVEELTKTILESGGLRAVNGHYERTGPTSAVAIPETLQDALMARLDRLGAAKRVAQVAAVIGRDFSPHSSTCARCLARALCKTRSTS